jgi:hypothetical protein
LPPFLLHFALGFRFFFAYAAGWGKETCNE